MPFNWSITSQVLGNIGNWGGSDHQFQMNLQNQEVDIDCQQIFNFSSKVCSLVHEIPLLSKTALTAVSLFVCVK